MTIDHQRQQTPGYLSRIVGLYGIPIAAALVALVLYLHTLSPSWGFVDGGEFSHICPTLGIAHPTGYPVITILGYFATVLIPAPVPVALNILAALIASTAVGLMTVLCTKLLRMIRPEESAGRGVEMVAAFVALTAGTGGTWWFQGTIFEVYGLHIVVLLTLSILFFRFVDRVKQGESSPWPGRLFALSVGLAFTTHLTTVLWMPALAIYYFGQLGFSRESFLRLLRLFPWVLLGLLPYLYLPIRSAIAPALYVDDIHSWTGFREHVTAKVFSQMMFSGLRTFAQQAGWFLTTVIREFAWIGIPLALWGTVTLFKRARLLAAWSLTLFVIVIFWMSNYDILDVDSHYLPAIIIIGLWCAIGLDDLRARFGLRVILPIGIGLFALNVAMHYSDADQSRNRYPEELARNMMEGLPPKTLILSDNWDFWIAGSRYIQFVEGKRTDVDVIYVTLFHYPWYRRKIAERYPELTRGLQQLSDEYQKRLDAFYVGDMSKGNPYEIYVAYISGIIRNAIGHRPVYVGGEVDPAIGGEFVRVPNGLALRLMPDSTYLPQEFPAYVHTSSVNRIDPYIAMIHEIYGRNLMARGVYEDEHGNVALARRYAEYALSFDPGYRVEETPDFPLNGEDQIAATEGFFEEIRRMLR